MAMKRAVKLKSAMITKVLSVWDRNLNRNARRIFRDNGQLRNLVLRQGSKSKLIRGAPVLTQECVYDVLSGFPAGREELYVVETGYKDGERSVKRYRRDRFT